MRSATRAAPARIGSAPAARGVAQRSARSGDALRLPGELASRAELLAAALLVAFLLTWRLVG